VTTLQRFGFEQIIQQNVGQSIRLQVRRSILHIYSLPNLYDTHTLTGRKYQASLKQEVEDPKVLRNYFVQMIQGLKYLHSKLVYVWDIKADNMMVTKSGVLKIMDFGMGKNLTKKRVGKKGMILNSTTYEHMPKHTAPELNRSGMGLHTGEKVSPGPPDIFNTGQLLLGMTGLKDFLPYMMRTKQWDLPAFESGGFGTIDSFEKLFERAHELKNRFDKDEYPDGPALYDLLTQMLHSDPEKRPTPGEILKHEWCCGFDK